MRKIFIYYSSTQCINGAIIKYITLDAIAIEHCYRVAKKLPSSLNEMLKNAKTLVFF